MKIEEIPLNLIDPDENQPRNYFDEEALTNLANNIKEVGLLSPIKVNKNNNDRYTIIFGNRRYLAYKLLGYKSILSIISENLSNEEIYLEQVAENVQRENFTPLEEAEAYKKLLSFGRESLGITQLSHRFGKSVSYINKKLSLLEFNGDIKQLIQSGRNIKAGNLTEEQALPLLQVPIHFQTLLAKKIADEEALVSDTKKIAELFSAKEEDLSTNAKISLMNKPIHDLVNEHAEYKQYLKRKESEMKKSNSLQAVGKNFIADEKSDIISFNLPLPVHKQAQKLFINLSKQSFNGKMLREINTMKFEERQEFLATVDHLINSLDTHLKQWTKIKDDLKKANIKLVKD